MLSRPNILCLCNRINGNIEVTEGRMLVSPDLNHKDKRWSSSN